MTPFKRIQYSLTIIVALIAILVAMFYPDIPIAYRMAISTSCGTTIGQTAGIWRTRIIYLEDLT